MMDNQVMLHLSQAACSLDAAMECVENGSAFYAAMIESRRQLEAMLIAEATAGLMEGAAYGKKEAK